MNKFKTLLLTVCAAAAMLFTVNTAQAQSDFTDDQVEKFVAINKETLPAQKEMQEKIMEALKAEGLTMERFQQLAAAAQTGDETLGGATEEEQTSFMTIAQSAMAMQQDMMMKYGEAAEKHDMDITTFQQMAMAYAQDAAFKEKIDGMMGGDAEDNADEAADEDEG